MPDKEYRLAPPPWWWLPLPLALAIVSFVAYNKSQPYGAGSDYAGYLALAQLALTSIGLVMACFLPNQDGFSRGVWIVLYGLALGPSFMFAAFDYGCRYNNGCL